MSTSTWAEGTLLQERGHDEVYVMRGGQRLHIPNPYVFEALGYQWGAIRIVEPGSLANVPVEHWATLGTPGSTVMVPGINNVHFPIAAATTKRHVAWGHEVRTIELRGWLLEVADSCYAVDPDWHYKLLLDTGWASSRGIDLHTILKIGNVLQLGTREANATPLAWCATPTIELELSGHPVKDQFERKCPPDWQPFDTNCIWEHGGVTMVVRWPFHPCRPRPSDPPLRTGQYVRVCGSLVTDVPHYDDYPELKTALDVWKSTWDRVGNPVRWSEIHPPDTIEVIDSRPLTETVRGVLVAAPGTVNWKPRQYSTLDVDLIAPRKPRGATQLRVQEFVGPESDLGTITEGNPTGTGARLTTLADRVHVHVQVGGRRSPFGGSWAKFNAIYRVFWT